jgi:hypothetical protein
MTSEAPPAEAPAATGTPPRVSMRQWVRDHDEKWLFVLLYLGLAVGLSVFVSLFWLVVVAALHLLFEIIRQSHYRDGRKMVGLHALWEIKLDVGLILLAFVLVLYIDKVLGILGVQSAARAAAVSRVGLRIGPRAAAWERNLRTFLLTVDEMARVANAGWMFWKRRKDGGADGEGETGKAETEKPPSGESREEVVTPARNAPPVPVWRQRWGIGDRIGVLLLVAGVLFLVLAPALTDHDWASAGAALLAELEPFPPATP